MDKMNFKLKLKIKIKNIDFYTQFNWVHTKNIKRNVLKLVKFVLGIVIFFVFVYITLSLTLTIHIEAKIILEDVLKLLINSFPLYII